MIGANTTILPGVKIGDGAIVSAGTLVHKDVPGGASWVGIQCVLFIRKSKWRLEKVHTRNVTFLFFLMNKKEIIEYNILFCFTESFILIDRRMCERRKQKLEDIWGKIKEYIRRTDKLSLLIN